MMKLEAAHHGPAKVMPNVFSVSLYIVFGAIILVFSLLSHSFLTFSNIYGTILNGAALILIACGINFALIAGMLDLSVAAVGYASGCLAGILVKYYSAPLWIAFAAGFLLALLVGGINSLLIVRFRMNTFLTTLGMMLLIRGIGKIITMDRTILMGKSISMIRQTKVAALGNFPVVLFVVVVVILFSQVILSSTRFGKYLIAVGSNEKAAQSVGINVARIKTMALLFTSGICGIAGMVWIITLGAVITRGMNGYEFLAIAAAVLGGTSLFGGKGSFFPGCFLGAMILLLIADGLTVVGVSPFVMPFVRGSIIFLAMYADSLRVRFA